MDNLEDLIAPGDFLLLFGYAILVYYLLRLSFLKKMDKKSIRLFTVFFAFKIFCAVLMCLLLVYYWGLSDNFLYFSESKNLIKLITTDVSNLKYFFLPVENYNEKIKFDNELTATVSSIGSEANFFIAKVSAILYPFSFGRYLIVNFLFSLIAAIGQFKFFLALSKRYPTIKKNIAVAVLLMPSVLIYSSYLNKETLCMGFMGFAIFNFFQIANKNHRIANSILLLINTFFICIVKPYIVIAFFAALLFIYFLKFIFYFWKRSVLSKLFIGTFLIVFLWLFLSNLKYFDPYIIEFAGKSNTFQQQYNSMEETSSFEFGEVETSLSGLLQKAPLGIYTTYFRPHLWEVNKPIILFSALESFLVLILTFWALFSRRKYIGPLLRNDFFANLSFFYTLIFGVFVGLTTFNFGSLVRYKIPAIPFLMMFVFLLLHYKPPKKQDVNKMISGG